MKVIIYAIVLLSVALNATAQIQRLDLLSPNGGEDIRENSKLVIKWSSNYSSGTVSLHLWDSRRSEWKPIADHVPVSVGKYVYDLPFNLFGDRFRVKVTDQSLESVFDMSDTYFEVKSPQLSQRVARSVSLTAVSATIYPNPVSGVVNIEVPDYVKFVEIVDISGAVVTKLQQGINTKIFRLDTSTLSSGTYFVNGHDLRPTKFIVE